MIIEINTLVFVHMTDLGHRYMNLNSVQGGFHFRSLFCRTSFFCLFLQRKTAPIRDNLSYVWSVSIAKDPNYPKYFLLFVVYVYSRRLLIGRGVQPQTLWWNQSNKLAIFSQPKHQNAILRFNKTKSLITRGLL